MASKLFLVFVVSVLVCTATARNLGGDSGNDEKTLVIPGYGGGGFGYGGGEGIDGGGTVIVGGGDIP